MAVFFYDNFFIFIAKYRKISTKELCKIVRKKEEKDMETKYKLIKSEDESGKTVYGIEICQQINDICLSYERAKELVDTCNKYGASIIHIFDIIDDFLQSDN